MSDQPPPEPVEPAPRQPAAWWVLLAALGCALVLRLVAYASDWAMHVDELRVAQNLAERGFGGLVRPLDHDQFVPVGLLWLMEALVGLGGYSEMVMRSVPMVSGLAAVGLAGWWAWRSAGPWAGVFAAGLLAASPKLIEQAVTFKQYSSDVLVTAGLMLAGWRLHEQWGRRGLVVYGLVCAVAVLFSHPSVFVIAGMTTALGLSCLVKPGGRKRIGVLACVVLPSAGLFGLLYALNYSAGADSKMLAAYWAADFMPAPSDPGFIKWWPKRFVWLMSPVAYPFTLIGGVAALIGAVALVARRRWVLGLMIALPILMTLAVAVAQAYPFAGRMVVFLSPLAAALIACGIAWPLEALKPNARRWAGPLLAAVLLAGLAWHAPLTEPRLTGGRYRVAYDAQANAPAGIPVVIDHRLRFHYLQAQRLGSAPAGWTELLVIDTQELQGDTRVLELADRLPPGPMPRSVRVVVPTNISVRRDTYLPTLERVVDCFVEQYDLADTQTQDGVYTLRFDRR